MNASPATKQGYSFNADLVRSIAIIFVVGIHILSPIYARPDFFNGSLWWASYILNVLFRTSVPLFVILSGYLVLGKETSIKQNLVRVRDRILVPLFSFYTIFHIYSYFAAQLRSEPYDYLDYFVNLSKNTYTYLYFLVILAFLYFLLPLFQALFNSNNKKVIKYTIIFFFVNAILGTFVRYLTLRVGDVFHTFTLWIVWVGYFLFGQWYKKYGVDLSFKKLTSIFIGGFIFTAIFGYLNTFWHINGNDIFYIGGQTYAEEYLSISVVVMSLALFTLIMKFKIPDSLMKSNLFTKSIQKLAQLSFGIYLIHPIVMDYINKFQGVTADSPSMPNLWIYVLVNASITFGASFILILLIQKIPVLRKIVGLK
ncbi:MAG: acyltransferase family protein [Pseudomonadales bacterium]|nr:acyltransferase family protein [Pseudomonadales bacterium]